MHRFLFPMNYLYRNIFDSCLGGCTYFLFLCIFFLYCKDSLEKEGWWGWGLAPGFFSCLSQEIWNSCVQTKMNKEPYSSIHSTQYERQETWYLIKRDLLRDLNKVNHLLSFALLSLNVRCKLIIIVGIMIKKNVTCTWEKCKYVSLSHWLLISQCSLAQKSKLDEINITKIKPAISCCYHVNIM